MRTLTKALTTSLFALSLLGSAAVYAQEQGGKTDADGMMGMEAQMTEMKDMMKQMNRMMTECNKMMENMMNSGKSGDPSGESEAHPEKAG